MSVRVKICGVTRASDALAAAELGADAIGFNFWPRSKRFIEPRRAAEIISKLPPFVTAVGVFVNASRAEIAKAVRASGIAAIQLHGDETPVFAARLPLPIIKALRVESRASLSAAAAWREAALLLDAPSSGFGGSGTRFDWSLARALARRRQVILAGGLDPSNVARAIREVQPWAVDVASGVERAPGMKDTRALARFIRAAKAR